MPPKQNGPHHHAGAEPQITDQQSLPLDGIPAPIDVEAEYVDAVMRAIHDLAASGRIFSGDDVRAITGPPPRAHLTGGLFVRASRAGTIIAVGAAQSALRSRNHGLSLRWIGAEHVHPSRRGDAA